MEESEVSIKEMGELYASLAKAKTEFQEIQKDAEVDYRNRDGSKTTFKYATLGAILRAVTPALSANGLTIIQTLVMAQDGSQNVMLETRLSHKNGASVFSSHPLPKPDPARPQAFGSALTYARRYSVAPMLGVESEADDDGQAAAENKHPPLNATKLQAPAKKGPPTPMEAKKELDKASGAKDITKPLDAKDFKKGAKFDIKLDAKDPELKIKQGQLKNLGFAPNAATKSWQRSYDSALAKIIPFEFDIIEN